MKNNKKLSWILGAIAAVVLVSCAGKTDSNAPASGDNQAAPAAGQSAVKDDVSQNDIVKVAVGSKDHTTLVAAVKAAEYVDVLANAGPFTVFAPTNAAFDALPAGTVDGLLKPEKKKDLRHVLENHVAVGGYTEDLFSDGQTLGTAASTNLTMHKTADGKWMVEDAHILGAVKASNGWVYVIDKVLVPKN
jgi:uncharacterized surface protein with fasciclin (FAS1) repeats